MVLKTGSVGRICEIRILIGRPNGFGNARATLPEPIAITEVCRRA
jgi:hypothetical protein